jgi:membrane protease subunit (stomatin/prohibitin family)
VIEHSRLSPDLPSPKNRFHDRDRRTEMLRRRPVAKVAAVGAVAHSAGKAGANAAAADADQTAQPSAEQAAPAEAAPSAEDSMEELTKLKGLLDSGVLTQAEFDAQKQKILKTM